MKILIATLSALALASTLSFAEDKPPAPPGEGGPGGPEGHKRPSPEEMMKKLDTNNDGSLSLEEFKAGPMAQRNPDRAEEAFKRMDKDGDGKLTLAELKEGRPPRPPGGPGQDGPGKGGPDGPKHGPKPDGQGGPKPGGQ